MINSKSVLLKDTTQYRLKLRDFESSTLPLSHHTTLLVCVVGLYALSNRLVLKFSDIEVFSFGSSLVCLTH